MPSKTLSRRKRKEGTFPPPESWEYQETTWMRRSVEVTGTLTSILLSVQTTVTLLGRHWLLFLLEMPRPEAIGHFFFALTVCFLIMAQSQGDSILLQRPAVFIKNLLSRYLVNHFLWCVFKLFCSYNRSSVDICCCLYFWRHFKFILIKFMRVYSVLENAWST